MVIKLQIVLLPFLLQWAFRKGCLMNIHNLLVDSQIVPDLKSITKEKVILELLDSIKQNKQVLEIDKIADAVFDREKLLSTGIGKGFAIPHCKTSAVEEIVVAIGKTINPIEFHSIDNKPVHIIILIASNININSEHLVLISKIGRLISDDNFVSKIKNCKSSNEILSVFKEVEK